MDLRTRLFIAVAASAVASPVLAQTGPAPQPPQADGAKKAKDPNEMVCERQRDPASRLASAKVCHTRAEWADLRHQDRQMIDEAQTRRGMNGR
jgi:hypothetical protein